MEFGEVLKQVVKGVKNKDQQKSIKLVAEQYKKQSGSQDKEQKFNGNDDLLINIVDLLLEIHNATDNDSLQHNAMKAIQITLDVVLRKDLFQRISNNFNITNLITKHQVNIKEISVFLNFVQLIFKQKQVFNEGRKLLLIKLTDIYNNKAIKTLDDRKLVEQVLIECIFNIYVSDQENTEFHKYIMECTSISKNQSQFQKVHIITVLYFIYYSLKQIKANDILFQNNLTIQKQFKQIITQIIHTLIQNDYQLNNSYFYQSLPFKQDELQEMNLKHDFLQPVCAFQFLHKYNKNNAIQLLIIYQLCLMQQLDVRFNVNIVVQSNELEISQRLQRMNSMISEITSEKSVANINAEQSESQTNSVSQLNQSQTVVPLESPTTYQIQLVEKSKQIIINTVITQQDININESLNIGIINLFLYMFENLQTSQDLLIILNKCLYQWFFNSQESLTDLLAELDQGGLLCFLKVCLLQITQPKCKDQLSQNYSCEEVDKMHLEQINEVVSILTMKEKELIMNTLVFRNYQMLMQMLLQNKLIVKNSQFFSLINEIIKHQINTDASILYKAIEYFKVLENYYQYTQQQFEDILNFVLQQPKQQLIEKGQQARQYLIDIPKLTQSNKKQQYVLQFLEILLSKLINFQKIENFNDILLTCISILLSIVYYSYQSLKLVSYKDVLQYLSDKQYNSGIYSNLAKKIIVFLNLDQIGEEVVYVKSSFGYIKSVYELINNEVPDIFQQILVKGLLNYIQHQDFNIMLNFTQLTISQKYFNNFSNYLTRSDKHAQDIIRILVISLNTQIFSQVDYKQHKQCIQEQDKQLFEFFFELCKNDMSSELLSNLKQFDFIEQLHNYRELAKCEENLNLIVGMFKKIFENVDEYSINLYNTNSLLLWMTSFYMVNPFNIKIQYVEIINQLTQQKSMQKLNDNCQIQIIQNICQVAFNYYNNKLTESAYATYNKEIINETFVSLMKNLKETQFQKDLVSQIMQLGKEMKNVNNLLNMLANVLKQTFSSTIYKIKTFDEDINEMIYDSFMEMGKCLIMQFQQQDEENMVIQYRYNYKYFLEQLKYLLDVFCDKQEICVFIIGHVIKQFYTIKDDEMLFNSCLVLFQLLQNQKYFKYLFVNEISNKEQFKIKNLGDEQLLYQQNELLELISKLFKLSYHKIVKNYFTQQNFQTMQQFIKQLIDLQNKINHNYLARFIMQIIIASNDDLQNIKDKDYCEDFLKLLLELVQVNKQNHQFNIQLLDDFYIQNNQLKFINTTNHLSYIQLFKATFEQLNDTSKQIMNNENQYIGYLFEQISNNFGQQQDSLEVQMVVLTYLQLLYKYSLCYTFNTQFEQIFAKIKQQKSTQIQILFLKFLFITKKKLSFANDTCYTMLLKEIILEQPEQKQIKILNLNYYVLEAGFTIEQIFDSSQHQETQIQSINHSELVDISHQLAFTSLQQHITDQSHVNNSILLYNIILDQQQTVERQQFIEMFFEHFKLHLTKIFRKSCKQFVKEIALLEKYLNAVADANNFE